MINHFSVIKKKWEFFTGSFQEFSVENRAFNLVCVFCIVLSIWATFINIWVLNLYANGLWTIVIGVIMTCLYYLSRFKQKFELSSTAFIILSYLMLGGNYFVNSGIAGPTVYGFLMTFLIIIIIAPENHYKLWMVTHLLIVPLLFIIELNFPYLIIDGYTSKFIQMSDHFLLYAAVAVIFFAMAGFIRINYQKEKFMVNARAKAIKIKNKELELSNKEKARLFSIIGHDLRSPLNSIQGYLEVLSTTDLDVKERKHIEKQLLGLTHGTSNLLNNLLNWSLEKNKLIELVKLDVTDTLEEVIALMDGLATKKNINLEFQIPQTSVEVWAEEDMLQLVVRNLLNNAIKFTRPEGLIKVTVSQAENRVVITVADNGVGIPIEKQKEIFSTRIKASAGTIHEKGVGLGLLLCYDFTKAMDGNISFESKEGVGTQFKVSLKMA